MLSNLNKKWAAKKGKCKVKESRADFKKGMSEKDWIAVFKAGPDLLKDNITGHWKRRWQLIEDNICGPWLLGDTFSITDIYIAVVSRWANLDNWRSENLPRVENIARGVANLPLCKEVWSRNFPAYPYSR